MVVSRHETDRVEPIGNLQTKSAIALPPGEIDTAIPLAPPGTDKIVETIPLRRLGAPEEVAKTTYYLCTEQSSYVTGAELHINGGWHV